MSALSPPPYSKATRSAGQVSADKVADVLLAIEVAPVAGFGLTPIAVRHMGCGPAEAFIILRIDGRRHGLNLTEANLLTRCLRDEQAFAGASLLARMIEGAAVQAWRLLSSGASCCGHSGAQSEPAA